MRAAALAAVGALGACGGVTGTYSLELTTAPGSTVLDGVARARLTLTTPYRQVEATRGGDGKFHLDLEVPANGPAGFVVFEGFDAAGALVGWGRSAPLPIAAVDATIAIYVAPPQSLAAAREALDPPRRDFGVAAFSFGPVLIGGTGADGAVLDTVDVYDLYGHALVPGADLPAPRTAPSAAAGDVGYAYVYGGNGSDGQPTGTLWRFDTQVDPRGVWQQLDSDPLLARADAAMTQVGPEVFLATGAPAAVIDGRTVNVTGATTLPALAGTATSVALDDLFYAAFVGDGSGDGGIVIVGADGVTQPVTPPASALRTGHGAAATIDDKVVVIGGEVAGVPTREALVLDPVNGAGVEARPDVLATPRVGAAVGGNGRVIVVAGGRDAGGALVADAEIFDAATLAPIATVPLVVPRADASAIPLANGQIMIAGGVDAAGAPIATIELYTPATP